MKQPLNPFSMYGAMISQVWANLDFPGSNNSGITAFQPRGDQPSKNTWIKIMKQQIAIQQQSTFDVQKIREICEISQNSWSLSTENNSPLDLAQLKEPFFERDGHHDFLPLSPNMAMCQASCCQVEAHRDIICMICSYGGFLRTPVVIFLSFSTIKIFKKKNMHKLGYPPSQAPSCAKAKTRRSAMAMT